MMLYELSNLTLVHKTYSMLANKNSNNGNLEVSQVCQTQNKSVLFKASNIQHDCV